MYTSGKGVWISRHTNLIRATTRVSHDVGWSCLVSPPNTQANKLPNPPDEFAKSPVPLHWAPTVIKHDQRK